MESFFFMVTSNLNTKFLPEFVFADVAVYSNCLLLIKVNKTHFFMYPQQHRELLKTDRSVFNKAASKSWLKN